MYKYSSSVNCTPLVIKPLELPQAFVPPSIGQAACKSLYDSQPLNPQRNEIRLLRFVLDETLSPPRPPHDGRIECSMEVASIDDKSLEYWALSYCWGPPDFDYEVICNGYPIPITRNLSLALLSMRRRVPATMAIWADQLCINQSDLDERASQVSIMRRIYAQCDVCVCHIGEFDATVEFAMMYIPYWLRKLGKYITQELYTNDGYFDEGEALLAQNATGDYIGIHALVEIAARPYFTRSWVIQETAVAPVRVLSCGALMFYYDDFRTVFEERVVPQLSQGMYRKYSRFTYAECQEILSRLSGLQEFRIAAMVALRQGLEGSYGSKLISLVARSSKFEAHDPRDKIFALQGIAGDGHLFAAPDYKKSVEATYREFADNLCSQGCGLYCIQEAGLGHSKYYALPSWVPDWASPRPSTDPDLVYPVDEDDVPRDEGALRLILSQAVKLGRAGMLNVSCYRLGMVTTVLDATPTHPKHEALWRNILFSAKQLIASVIPPETEDISCWEMLYKLITSGRRVGSTCYTRRESRVQPARKFAELMRDLENGQVKSLYKLAIGNDIHLTGYEKLKDYQELREHGDLRDQRDLAAQPSSELQGYTIGLVDSRWLARIPNSTKVDDIVIYIQGAAAPCVVRDAPETCYHYIGTAYVEGRMTQPAERDNFNTLSIV
jgi:hypothetical protein